VRQPKSVPALRNPPPEPILRERTREAPNHSNADVVALERQLGDTLGLKVAIANNGSKGTVTLHYSSLDQLDLVCQRLSGEPI
jgi:ParB family chromosome partitioning protein